MAKFTKSQIDRLGDRLRKNAFNELDLRILDDYRRSFNEAYSDVVQTLRERLSLEPTGRPAKSTSSIIEKLHRESIRLTQIQDIAGCRIVVSDIVRQDQTVGLVQTIYPHVSIVDRRASPSHGYRAVHAIVQIKDRLVEIQIRSTLQHLWAELSEKLSDQDPAIKYGGGHENIRKFLLLCSETVTKLEGTEMEITHLQNHPKNSKINPELISLGKEIEEQKEKVTSLFNNAIVTINKTGDDR